MFCDGGINSYYQSKVLFGRGCPRDPRIIALELLEWRAEEQFHCVGMDRVSHCLLILAFQSTNYVENMAGMHREEFNLEKKCNSINMYNNILLDKAGFIPAFDNVSKLPFVRFFCNWVLIEVCIWRKILGGGVGRSYFTPGSISFYEQFVQWKLS